MVESLFFLVTGVMFFPPLVVMRVKALLSNYGFWSWLLVFFLALGFDGAFMHPFSICTVGLLLLADIFGWSWKKLSVFMSILLVLWGFLINWWTLLVLPLIVVEAWADAE